MILDTEDKNDDTEYFFHEESIVDLFHTRYLNDIDDLVFYIKNTFSIKPYFLYYLNCRNLIDLFILNEISKKRNDNYNFKYFYNEFEDDINFSYNAINNFSSKKRFLLDYKIWCKFCFHYSFLECL